MNPKTKLNFELICAVSGWLWCLTYGYFWTYVAEIQPPVAYTLTPEQVTAFYIPRHSQILWGMGISAIVGGFWIPWTAQLSIVMARIEGEGPVFALTALIGGTLAAFALIFTPVMWLMPIFEPSDGRIMKAFSDFAYLCFNATAIVSVIQALTSGIVGLADKREQPVFPRWACWVAILAGLAMVTVLPTTWIMAGPMSLNGSYAGWVPGAMYFIWTVVLTYYMVRDIFRRRRTLSA